MSCEPPGSSGSAAANLNADGDSDDEIINWAHEGQAIIKDLKPYVADIHISTELPLTETGLYLNITTLEEQHFCVKADSAGFRIVSSSAHNTIDEAANGGKTVDEQELENEMDVPVYETPYALLNKVSPRYVDAFGNALCKQLLQLAQMRTEFNEEDEDDLNDDEVDGNDEHVNIPTESHANHQ